MLLRGGKVNRMSSHSPLRILSVESSDESRSILHGVLTKIPDFVLVADMHSTDETLLKIRADDSIDIMVVDLALDGDAVGLIKQVRHLNPAVRVLIYTASDSPQDIFAAMDAGADAYVLKENLRTVLETAIRSARLGTVWLDPGIARQVLQIMETAASTPSRVLPTGFMPMPLMPDEESILSEVAASACTDGVCMVDPSFVRKLKRFARAASE